MTSHLEDACHLRAELECARARVVALETEVHRLRAQRNQLQAYIERIHLESRAALIKAGLWREE